MFFIVFALVSILCSAEIGNGEDPYSKSQVLRAISYVQCEAQLDIVSNGIPSEPVTEQNITFVIYSRQNPDPITLNTYEYSKSAKNSGINFHKGTVLFVHGFTQAYQTVVPVFTNTLLAKEDINLIFMNWGSYAYYSHKYTLESTLPRLGDILAAFFRQIIDAGADPKQIYGIGISSGVPPIGIAGRKTNPKIGKILGIDPVGACYNYGHRSEIVSPGDADFVQVIHCSAGRGEPEEYLGDATFYMNGGVVQPQCVNDTATTMDEALCSHKSCLNYIYETFSDPDRYIGIRCDTVEECTRGKGDKKDTARMGYFASTGSRGKYFVSTESSSGSARANATPVQGILWALFFQVIFKGVFTTWVN